uniref:Reverse transcriptase domain-containing protein n=1 Tax=Tanacetum cinerariifolium TaxID=118510 RepID=A0A6L2JGT3_TANCI|nr:reverse transcriptase domain-containing protein [Tanacetum cinerariifolium]
MPFGLKNDGATYQRLIDSTFQTQLGRNLKAYMGDLVIKSKTKRDMIMDIAETFDNLQKINMKLNPMKCSFGIGEGKFWGYIVTSKGIRANPKKTKAIADMQSPKTLKEIQSLSGKLAALNQFLPRLRIARKMKVQTLDVQVDLKLMACQMNDDFLASNEGMAKYLAKAKEQAALFKKFSIKNIPRNQNQKADVLRKLASEVNTIVEEEKDNWMTPIIKCLEEGVWTTDENEARTLQMKIGQYVVEDGVLFKKSYLSPMLRCVGSLQANYIIREVHEGACGIHVGARSVVAKIMRQGYYWPTMHGDTKEPFYQWGLDILGPLPEGPGKLKFIIVAIDYFTKWIEANSLAKTTEKEAQLVNAPFKSWCKKWKIKQMNMEVAHPQANGLVEIANKSLMHGLKARLGKEIVGWVDELANILWAHRTMLKTSNGETSFSLTYGSEAVISAEIGMPTYRTIHFNESHNKEEMQLNLDLSQERRETAAIREAKYKKKVE